MIPGIHYESLSLRYKSLDVTWASAERTLLLEEARRDNMPICNAMEVGCLILAQLHAGLVIVRTHFCAASAMCPAFEQFEGVVKGLPAAYARFCCSHVQPPFPRSE
jgi:hypothetical protein